MTQLFDDRFARGTVPLLGILRGVTSVQLEPILEIALKAGLPALEITMNTSGASGLVAQLVELADDRIQIGAGTVTTAAQAEQAISAGATFLVTPAVVPEVLEVANRRKIALIGGALTPSEVLQTWQSGAKMVKVFPASRFGPSYFKDLKGPFDQIPLMAVGGVSPQNIHDYFAAGAEMAAFGGSIFKQEWLAGGDWTSIDAALNKLVAAIR